MPYNHKTGSAGGLTLIILILINTVIIRSGYIYNEKWLWAIFLSAPLLIIAIKSAHDK